MHTRPRFGPMRHHTTFFANAKPAVYRNAKPGESRALPCWTGILRRSLELFPISHAGSIDIRNASNGVRPRDRDVSANCRLTDHKPEEVAPIQKPKYARADGTSRPEWALAVHVATAVSGAYVRPHPASETNGLHAMG